MHWHWPKFFGLACCGLPTRGFPTWVTTSVCSACRSTDQFWLAVSLTHEWKSLMQIFCCTIQPRFRKGANVLQVGRSHIFYRWVDTGIHIVVVRGGKCSPVMYIVSKVKPLLFPSTHCRRGVADLEPVICAIPQTVWPHVGILPYWLRRGFDQSSVFRWSLALPARRTRCLTYVHCVSGRSFCLTSAGHGTLFHPGHFYAF